jgi:endonuclease/exonuclease/phosphatase family metal-dependent hydrolase
MPRLRVMTYNVRYFGHGTRGVFSTRDGVRRIADAIASMSPLCDLIALQEVEHRSLRSALVTWHPKEERNQLAACMSELAHALDRRGVTDRYEPHYFPAHRYTLAPGADLYTTGLAMLVGPRLAVVSEDESRIEDITHRRGAKALKQTRIVSHLALRVRDAHREGLGPLQTEEADLDVFNTHLSLPGPFYKEFWTGDARMGYGPNQLAEANRLLEAMRQRRRSSRTVLMGDFNSLPDSPVDRLFQEEGALVDALAATKGLETTGRNRWATAGFMTMRMAIDRIYSCPGVRWLDFEESVPFAEPGRFAGLSDHVPIVGRLQLERCR